LNNQANFSSTAFQIPDPFQRKLLWWVPTLIWLMMLVFFSTDTFSAEHTGGILWNILHYFVPGISLHHFQMIHFFVRKSAHFCFYGILSLLAFYSWRTTMPRRARWSFRWSGLALLLTLVAASLDEFHQSFVPSRGASPRDVLLDMTGALFIQILIAAFTTSA